MSIILYCFELIEIKYYKSYTMRLLMKSIFTRIHYSGVMLLIFCSILPSKSFGLSVKFFVNMSIYISQNKFNAVTDVVYLRGNFNSYDLTNPMTSEGNGLYSVTLNLNSNSGYYFRFFINTAGAENDGCEGNVGANWDGQRQLSTGTNNLTLSTYYFNNSNIPLRKSTDHFNFYCEQQAENCLNDFSQKLETNYASVISKLETTTTSKIDVQIYPSLTAYHNAMGYPESPDWVSGSAMGKTLIFMTSPNNAGPTTYNDMVINMLHEFVHIAVNWKQSNRVVNWLTEGCATYLSGQYSRQMAIPSVKYQIQQFGYKPTLSFIEADPNFGGNNGYPLSFSVVDFIIDKFGNHGLAEYVGTLNFSVLGYNSKEEFQTGWWAFLDKNYLGISSVEEENLQKEFSLSQNYPNPFNPTTEIGYQISAFGKVQLKIFNVLGEEAATLVNEEKTSGTYKVKFDGNNLSSGIYFYTLKVGSFLQTKKMILMK
jgi:hypothetical protein